jgi:aminoglycoside 2'-N-acetyltransferase I
MSPIVRCPTSELGDRIPQLRAIFEQAWSGDEAFDDDDWQHAIGGTHFLHEVDGTVLSHVSVVDRVLEADGRPLRTGYVEAVATREQDRGRGYASALMREATALIDDGYELGALGTDLFGFYGRLGWQVWRGPTGVRTDHGVVRTPEEDGFVMFRRTPATPELDIAGLLTCDWRAGDVW